MLLVEGRKVHYVERQVGHGPELTLRTYGYVIDDVEDSKDIDAEALIRAAREGQNSLVVLSALVDVGV